MTHKPLSDTGGALETDDGSETFAVTAGIPQLIAPERVEAVEEFSHAYGSVRVAEGRTSEAADYYRALPYTDMSQRFADQWAQRATSFDALSRLLNEESSGKRSMSIVDAGAGNCWLSARLAARGHDVVAIDANDDDHDGLGARRHHPEAFQVARAELMALPLGDSVADVVVFNAAAHYVQLRVLVDEARRVVAPGGAIVIVDSPVYEDASAGEAMVHEMRDYIRGLGVEPAAYSGQGFFTRDEFAASGLSWRFIEPAPGRFRSLKRLVAGVRAGREVAVMPLVTARVPHDGTRHGLEASDVRSESR